MSVINNAVRARLAIKELDSLLQVWATTPWWKRWSIGRVIVVKLNHRFAEIEEAVLGK